MAALGTGMVLLSVLTACGVPRSPAVTIQHNADGTITRAVRIDRAEQAQAAQRHLLESIPCPNYEVVEVGSGEAQSQQPADRYWVRYRCLPTP